MSHHEILPLDSFSETLCVLLNCDDSDRLFPSVTPDEVKSALDASKILLQKGHRRIGFVNCIENVPASTGRLEGYKQALEVYDVPFDEKLICYGKSDQDSAYECTLQLMQLSSPATALLCFNDQMAMGVYQALYDLKLKIPNDVAVMGFDNLEIIAAYLRPKLSTMELPHYEMGQWAVNFLVEHLEREERPKPIQHTIECRYIERSSV
jgi:LacI family transcriptional regulator